MSVGADPSSFTSRLLGAASRSALSLLCPPVRPPPALGQLVDVVLEGTWPGTAEPAAHLPNRASPDAGFPLEDPALGLARTQPPGGPPGLPGTCRAANTIISSSVQSISSSSRSHRACFHFNKVQPHWVCLEGGQAGLVG